MLIRLDQPPHAFDAAFDVRIVLPREPETLDDGGSLHPLAVLSPGEAIKLRQALNRWFHGQVDIA